MPGPERDIVIGADGFLGRNLVPRLRAEGREVVEIGRAAGDLSDWANVERALRDAAPAGRIFHVVTRQRTGAIQYDIQGELLAINTRIHLNVLEAWRLYLTQDWARAAARVAATRLRWISLASTSLAPKASPRAPSYSVWLTWPSDTVATTSL